MSTTEMIPKTRGRPRKNISKEEKLVLERERLRKYYLANKEKISDRRKVSWAMANVQPVFAQ